MAATWTEGSFAHLGSALGAEFLAVLGFDERRGVAIPTAISNPLCILLLNQIIILNMIPRLTFDLIFILLMQI